MPHTSVATALYRPYRGMEDDSDRVLSFLSKTSLFRKYSLLSLSILDAVGSSRILIGKQKTGLTFNSDKLGGNDFTKFSKLTMCSV